MTKHCILAGLVLAAAMGGGEAEGKGTLAVTLADYNAAQVATNHYVVTVPEGQTIGGNYYQAAYTLASGTKLEAGSSLTLALPAGFTFASTPQIYYSGSEFNPNSNVIGAQTATFTMPAAILASSGLSLFVFPEFSINTPTSFASQYGGSPVPLSIQATGNVNSANNDPSPVSQAAFAHAVGSLPDTRVPGSGQINLANPYYGDQFVASGRTIADSGLVAAFSIDTELNDPFNSNAAVLNASGQLNSLAAGDTANVTIEGYFNGVGLAYASTNTSGNCQGSIPSGSGVYVAAVTDSSLSFSGIPIDTPVQICMIPYGVMWANNTPYVYTYSAGAGVTDYFGGLSQTTAGNFYTYNTPSTLIVNVAAGSPQSTSTGATFCTPLAVQVYDTSTTPVYALKGIDVLFSAPSSGQGGTFSNHGSFIFVGTDSHGFASAAFATNSTAGVYTDTASVGMDQVLFGLTNEPGNNEIFCSGFEL